MKSNDEVLTLQKKKKKSSNSQFSKPLFSEASRSSVMNDMTGTSLDIFKGFPNKTLNMNINNMEAEVHQDIKSQVEITYVCLQLSCEAWEWLKGWKEATEGTWARDR